MRINNFSSLSPVKPGRISQGFGISLSLKSSGYLYRVKPRNGVICKQESCTGNADHFSGKFYKTITEVFQGCSLM